MSSRIFLSAIILVVFQLSSISQTHTLLKDINPGEMHGFIHGYIDVVKWNNLVYFVGMENYENQLWVSNGSSENTKFITNVGGLGTLHPMAALESHIVLSGQLNDTFGLIRSDGTSSGTSLFYPVDNINRIMPIRNQSAVYIQNYLETYHLYGITNGLVSGTDFVDDVLINPEKIVTSSFGSSIIVSGSAAEGAYCAAFISDGSVNGTMCLEDYFALNYPGEVPSQIITAVGSGSHLFLQTRNDGDFVFDGNVILSVDLKIIPESSYVKAAFEIGNRSLLFITDGGLIIYDHANKTAEPLSYDVHDFARPVLYENHVYFHNWDQYLTKTDGTVEGTQQLSTHIIGGPALYNAYLFAHEDKLYYNTWNGHLNMRYYDLENNTDSFFATISHDDQPMTPFIMPVDNKLMYMKRTAELGTEWWVFDPLQVGTHNSDVRSILCYPNPVHSTLSFDLGNHDFSSVGLTIYNAIGMEVKNEILLPGQFQVDVSSLVPGSYYFEIKDAEDRIYRSNFVKE